MRRERDEEPDRTRTILWAVLGVMCVGLFCVVVPVGLIALDTVRRSAQKKADDEKPTPPGPSALDLPRERIVDLVDNPSSYKGRTLRMPLELVPLKGGNNLRDYVGRVVWFHAWSPKAKLDIHILVPEGMAVPNAQGTDRLIVTFVCKEGSLKDGNEAIAIARP